MPVRDYPLLIADTVVEALAAPTDCPQQSMHCKEDNFIYRKRPNSSGGLEWYNPNQMLRAVYDANANGIVDDAEKLGGQLPSSYAKQLDLNAANSNITTAQTTANSANSAATNAQTAANNANANAQAAQTAANTAQATANGKENPLTFNAPLQRISNTVSANVGTGANQLAAGNHTHANYEPTIANGTTSQYWRGDKTFQTLDKSAAGLSNVDNTSDLNKPISSATQAALNAIIIQNGKIPVPLFDSVSPAATSTTTETDLHNFAIPANTVSANNQKIFAQYAGIFTANLLSTQRIRVYLFGQNIFDSGALTLSLVSSAWTVKVWIQRAGAASAYADVELLSNGLTAAVKQNVLLSTGLDFTATGILKITGTASVALGGMVRNMATGELRQAA